MSIMYPCFKQKIDLNIDFGYFCVNQSTSKDVQGRLVQD